LTPQKPNDLMTEKGASRGGFKGGRHQEDEKGRDAGKENGITYLVQRGRNVTGGAVEMQKGSRVERGLKNWVLSSCSAAMRVLFGKKVKKGG